MDELDYKILLTLKIEQNLSKTAEKLFVSQPSLTYRLKNLEKELDVVLLVRTKLGVKLTQQCEYLISQIEKVDNIIKETKHEIKKVGKTASGKISIGVPTLFCHYELPKLLKAFNMKFPDITIDIKSTTSDKIQKMLKNEVVSIGFIRGETRWAGDSKLLFSEPICIASKHKIFLEEIETSPYIHYQTSLNLMYQIDYWWNEKYIKNPNMIISCNNMDTCLELLKAGVGWSVLPTMGLKNFDGYKQDAYYNSGEPLIRNTSICYYEPQNLSPEKYFIDFVIDYYS
jgi:DNA-binding transcriptional LysR family regulator